MPADDHIKTGLIEFAKLGLQYLFLSNGSAIIAILSNKSFFATKCKCTLAVVIILYLLGSCMALIATGCSYMCHRKLTEEETRESTWICRAIGASIASFVFFVLGCIVALVSFF